MAWYSIFSCICASPPNNRAQSSLQDSHKPMSISFPKAQSANPSLHAPKNVYQKKITPPLLAPKSTSIEKFAIPLSRAPKIIPQKTAPSQALTHSSSSNSGLKPSMVKIENNHSVTNLNNNGSSSLGDKISPHKSPNLVVKKNGISALSHIEKLKKQLPQAEIKTSQQGYRPDRTHLRATAETIENWNKKETKNKDDKVASCAQILADLAACFDEGKVFWELRKSYIDGGCEKSINKGQYLGKNICYAIPYGITQAYYNALHSIGSKLPNNSIDTISKHFAGSAVGEAFLHTTSPITCSISYTGSNFAVELIKNYKQIEDETPDLKSLEESMTKYVDDLQYALNRCLHTGAIRTVEVDSILYIAMCYGYNNDQSAKVVTIVDKECKQHVFVVSQNSTKGVSQISDGSSEINALIPYRYLVPQSTVKALKFTV